MHLSLTREPVSPQNKAAHLTRGVAVAGLIAAIRERNE
jgi:hypothetical protein